MSGVKRIAISGYFGFGNLGDEAILETLIDRIRTRFGGDGDLEVTVFSNSPAETSTNYQVKAVPRWNFFKMLRSIFRADLLISGGGGLLQDQTSSLSLWYYLGVMILAILVRTPVYILGQGIGPIDNRVNKWLTSVVLRRVQGALVRDPESFDFVHALTGEERTREAVDLATLYPGVNRAFQEVFPTDDKPVVAAALKDVEEYRTGIAETVGAGMEGLADRYDANLVFFSTHSRADRRMASELNRSMNARCRVIDTRDIRPAELIGMVREADLLIGGRLHALEFALLANTSVIGISYDPKMDHLVQAFNNCNSNCKLKLWHPEELDQREAFVEDLMDLYQSRESFEESIPSALSRLQDRTEEELQIVFQWMENGLQHESK